MTRLALSGICIAATLAAFFGLMAGAPGAAHGADYSGLPEIPIAPGEAVGESVDQENRAARTLRSNLTRIRLPAGFRISLYALAPDARHMAIGPEDGTVFVGTRRSRVWVVSDTDKDGSADRVEQFAPTIAMKMPNGPCFSPEGDLYLSERNRILVFPGAERFREAPAFSARVVVAEGALVPEADESRGHSARVCRIGPDDRLYVALGQPYNVSPRSKIEHYRRIGIGGIVRMDRLGGAREVFATGIRNSVGMDFNPANGELWFTDNQVDGMGDDIPPGEINRATVPGQSFGFPWFGGGSVRTHEHEGDTPPDGQIPPEVEMDAHAADLGMMFYRGTMFPQGYRGGIFSAQHGSWDRRSSIGARVMFTRIEPDGSAGQTMIFAEGWLDPAQDAYWGRPVDVAELADGSILVSDDHAGAIYRIWYEGS